MKPKYILLVLILLFGFIIRTLYLHRFPVGFTWDEAAIGYNAYSLLRTGRDEHGQTAPVVFKSFGDYKPGLYIYFTVPAVKIFGLNEFATRLPSAVFGTLLLVVIYALSRILFPKSLYIGHYSLFIASINPWLIQFSRGAWEANLNLLLTTLGVTLFLFYLKKNSTFYILHSTFFFGLTFWAYQSAKLTTPMLIISLYLIYQKRINIKKLFLPAFLFSAILFPVLLNVSSQSGRLKVFSVFSYTRRESDVAGILRQDNTQKKNFTYFIFHSELLDQGRGVLQRYLNHLSPRFLFSEGDWTSLRHSVYKHGYFYLIEITPFAIGLFILFSQLQAKSYKLLAAWLFLAPIPAALSRDLVSGVRSLALSIPLIIIIALGLSCLARKKIFSIFYILLSIFFFTYYCDFYYLHQPYYSAAEWLYPYKQAYARVETDYDRYSRFHITDALGQPYIFALFYLRYDPRLYQQQTKLVQTAGLDVHQVREFDKFVFGPVFWPGLRGQTGTMTIGGEYELPEKDLNIDGLVRLGDISYPNGQLGLRVVGLP